jgi:threonine/homoserine/homoserine lactone efflux protein
MLEDYPILLAALTGFISGLVVCIPVGPINLTIIHEGARRGFRWALLIGLGATVMEVIYCAIAFTGFASFFQKGLVKAAMEVTSFVFLLFLGIKFVLAKNVAATTHLSAAADKLEERIEGRLHPHSAFMIGFVRVMANPAVLLFWIILAANFISREWVEPTGPTRFICVSGVAAGAGVWFTCLSYVVSLRHKKVSERTLLRLEHFSGIALLVLALIHGVNIIWQLARHRI